MAAQSLFQIIQMKHQMKQALVDIKRLLEEWAANDQWLSNEWTTVDDVSFSILDDGELGISVKFSNAGLDDDRDPFDLPTMATLACADRAQTLQALYSMPVRIRWYD